MQILHLHSPTDAANLARFQQVALDVYRADPLWVAQSEGAFLRHLQPAAAGASPWMRAVVVVDGDRPLARAAALHSQGAVDARGLPQGYIAFFECLEDAPQAGALALQACEDLLRARGAASIQAPRVDNMLIGLQVAGFDLPQTVLTPHNPPYYLDIFQGQDYQVTERLLCFLMDRSAVPRIPTFIERSFRGYHTRPFDRLRLEDEIRLLNSLQTEIFSSHPGYVPRSLAEDRAMVESFLPMLDDDLVIIAEDEQNRAVGILVCLPDVYQAFQGKKIDTARLISIGAVPRVAQRGIGVLMAVHLARNLLAKGYQVLEGSWIREDNLPPQNLVRRFGGQKGRAFVVLEKQLS